ncbi:hypothetical protein FPV67DRAFT_1510697 [Lyophyllum atratum]|nr:hypothetical protein FPV67DRAFT_1510697 [Lyophyllum atratum]
MMWSLINGMLLDFFATCRGFYGVRHDFSLPLALCDPPAPPYNRIVAALQASLMLLRKGDEQARRGACVLILSNCIDLYVYHTPLDTRLATRTTRVSRQRHIHASAIVS